MPIFQNTVVTKYLQSQNKESITLKWELFKAYFHNIEIQDNIRNSKEEQFQEGFLRELFVKILGYTLNPQPNFNLTTEHKNVKDSKKADGAIIINDNVRAVIELKGTNTTDLGKIEVQAFGYKNNQSKCTYVITSNFEKIRFYIDNAIEHIEFNLFTLSEKDFELLYLCLAFENIKNDIPSKIKKDSLSEEDVITKSLYKDYSFFKRELHQNLVSLNPQYDSLTLFKESQTLLDRFLFLFFAEDRQLLPPNSVRLVLSQWKKLQDLDAYAPLFERFKKYFGYLNTGFKGKNYNVYAYNGGLFKPNEVLDTIVIDDDLLYKHTLKLSDYDFASEVDVNILGHIFENSLNEIDEVKAELEGQVVDKSKSKRKKDGVFYTPKYITKYIVENTVGKLCDEKKIEFEIFEDDYITDKKRQKKTIKGLVDKLTVYREWLLQLTICDPACGSGAFLNQALDFLINEHGYIDELQAKLFGDAMVLSDVEKSILENNLFGVDLNEESVEIAKLSLWLRTAVPNRKLNDLSNNIKCGNSLIDDPEIAGDKAFNWQQEFPHIFVKGGFDVIIGNPPYVGTKRIDVKDREYYWEKYKDLLFSEMDLYQIFLYKSVFELLSDKGYLGFITPNSYFTNVSFKKLREYLLLNTTINTIIDFPYRFYPFDDVNTETSIITIKKELEVNNITEFKVVDKTVQRNFSGMIGVYRNEVEIPQILISKKYNGLIIINANSIINKLIDLDKRFGDYLELHKGWMSIPNKVNLNNRLIEKGIFTRLEIENDTLLASLCNLYLEGRDIHRYYSDKVEKYVYIKEIDKKTKKWHLNPKIILQRIVGQNKNKIFATVDLNNYIIFPNANLVNLKDNDDNVKFYLSILNSTLISYFYNSFFGESNTNLTKLAFESIPIPNISGISQTQYIVKVDLILLLIKNLQEVSSKFQRTLQREFEQIDKFSKKLEFWYELNFADFLKELKKKKVELSLSQKAEWEDYFLAEQQKAVAIQTHINQTDAEIDQMVYELYGLTDEEIKIVENS
jgi:type I restriction-modification system DNA methylase subunit